MLLLECVCNTTIVALGVGRARGWTVSWPTFSNQSRGHVAGSHGEPTDREDLRVG